MSNKLTKHEKYLYKSIILYLLIIKTIYLRNKKISTDKKATTI